MASPITVVIADDHPIFRAGLRQIIADEKDLQILAETSNGIEAWKEIVQRRPAIAVLDLAMPGLDGLEVARKIQEQKLSVSVVLLTGHKGKDLFHAAISAGVRGYLLKDNAAADLVRCLFALRQGSSYFCPDFTEYLLGQPERERNLAEQKPGLASLTPAERRILKMIASGQTSKEIADALDLSGRTVDNHRFRMSEKLGLRGTHSLIKFALDNKAAL
jgi:DNA-binding NarL/FixJ family response regulator